MKLLHVDASPKRERSNSRTLARYFLDRLGELAPLEIDYLDVTVDTPPLTEDRVHRYRFLSSSEVTDWFEVAPARWTSEPVGTVTITARVLAAGAGTSIVNPASIAGADPDPATANNTTSATTAIDQAANLAVTKSVAPAAQNVNAPSG